MSNQDQHQSDQQDSDTLDDRVATRYGRDFVDFLYAINPSWTPARNDTEDSP